MTDAIYILNTKVLKDAGYEGSLNDLADNIAENGGVVSGSFEETGEPVMTVYGIEEESLLDLLEEGGVENAIEIIEQSRVEDNDDTDYDSELENVDNQDEHDVDEGDDPDENIYNDDPDDEPNDDVDDNFDDTPNDDIDDEGDDDEIIELDDDELDELGDLHTEEEELHDQEEEIHDQEEELDPDNEENELHKQEEEIHDKEEERHDEIEDELDIDTDEDEELDENKKHRGTQNLSESVTHDIINRVKDAYILKRIQDRAEVIDKLNESCKNITVNMNPWSNVVVNGTPIWKYRNLDIVDMIKESKTSYKELYKKYKSLNESHSRKKDIVKALKKQKKLIEILESEALFRNINKKNTKLNEDAAIENNDNSNDQSQEATLTSIVFKVKNADEFIKVLTDNGIPAEALKKGTTDESNTDNNQNQEQNDQQSQEMPPMDNSMSGGGAPAGAPAPAAGANPFESVTTRLTKNNKLNEAGNPFDELAGEGQESASLGDSDQPGPIDGVDPLNADEAQSAGEGEEVILTDTQYAAQVQKILEDVYGYSKKDFEDKIGGEIQGSEEDGSDEDNIFNDADGSDDGSENVEEDDSTTGKEESISPEDIFSDLPGGL